MYYCHKNAGNIVTILVRWVSCLRERLCRKFNSGN